MLDLYGDQWWTGFGEAGGDNVLIFPGVSLTEAQEFVDLLYGRQNVISDRHFTVREDIGVASILRIISNFVNLCWKIGCLNRSEIC